MRVLYVSSEVHPLAKSGGLADVSHALPLNLREAGMDARILMPGYEGALRQLRNPRIETRLPGALGVENAALISGELPGSGVPISLIYAPSLYSRPGGPYQDEHCQDWEDNPRRFAFLAKVATDLALGRLSSWKADLVHANDWHTSLVPFFLSVAGKPRPPVVFTIHNLAFQGNFPASALAQADIPSQFFTPDGVEFYGRVSFLKAALRYSDKITTVSPRYAEEILTPEFGCGFEGVLQSRRKDLIGILNGIDTQSWNPATDPVLPQSYSPDDIAGKRICKSHFQKRLALAPSADAPLFGFVSRLTHQKMADILFDAIPDIMACGAQLAIVGDGEPGLRDGLCRLQERHAGQLCIQAYDESLAHNLHAACDLLLAPARFEPCGLTQMYAMRYGTVPIVRATGGLADTVTDARPQSLADASATGIVFSDPDKQGLMSAVRRALALYQEPLAWRRLQLAGMKQDFGWRASAAKYVSLYREVTGLRSSIPSSRDASVVPEGLKRSA